MADDNEACPTCGKCQKHGWSAADWCKVIGAVFIGLTSLAGTIVGSLNRWGPSGQIEHVEKADQRGRKIDKIEAATEVIEKKTNKIEKKVEEVAP